MGARRQAHRFRVVACRRQADLFDGSGRFKNSTTHKFRKEHRTGVVRILQVRRLSVITLARMKFFGLLFLLISLVTVAACKDKTRTPTPPVATVSTPPTPPPPAPVVTLRAQPATIDRGS